MIFELSWSWYEEYRPILFEGPDKTEDEWKYDCLAALRACFDEYMTSPQGWASLPDWIEVAAVKLAEYGYRQFKPVKCGFWGCYLPKDRDDDAAEQPELAEQIEKMRQYNLAYDKEVYA